MGLGFNDRIDQLERDGRVLLDMIGAQSATIAALEERIEALEAGKRTAKRVDPLETLILGALEELPPGWSSTAGMIADRIEADRNRVAHRLQTMGNQGKIVRVKDDGKTARYQAVRKVEA